jgi:outer membrane protein assembly factor BamB
VSWPLSPPSGGAAVAAYLTVLQEPGDISNPDVPFVAPATTPSDSADTPKKAKRPRTESWPRYGYTKTHTRSFEPERALRGPWRQVWQHKVKALTEFPPIVSRGEIYQLIDDGELVSLVAQTGKVRWTKKIGALAASSPAIDDDRVYAVLLEGEKGSGRGRVVALRRKGGKRVWAKPLPGRVESSPLLHGDRLYVGSEHGRLYCLDADTGREIWTYQAAGAIKGSPTYADGKLYFGNYGGDVQAVRASTGKLVWKSGAARGVVRSGNFYATAAVAYGRVYIGNTDGRVYSFSSRDGKLAWAHQTGGYVYSSSAIDTVPGVGPTVFVGSYDGTFYALDARSGDVRWRHRAGGKISGSPTVIGNTVYFANLAARTTIGLATRNGKVVFRRKPGSFDPMISDGRRLYMTGSFSLTALEPKRAAEAREKQAKRSKPRAKKSRER